MTCCKKHRKLGSWLPQLLGNFYLFLDGGNTENPIDLMLDNLAPYFSERSMDLNLAKTVTERSWSNCFIKKRHEKTICTLRLRYQRIFPAMVTDHG